MASRNRVEALIAAAKAEVDIYNDLAKVARENARENVSACAAMFKENQAGITSALTGRRKSFEGPLAPFGYGLVGGLAGAATIFWYPLDRLVVGKSAREIKEECEKGRALFE